MPKRSERKAFGSAFTVDNPFEGLELDEIYNKVQWGNKPNEIINIDSSEPLIALGYVAKIFFRPKGSQSYDEGAIHLAIGADSNLLYMFPKGETYIPRFNEHTWLQGPEIRRTDYYSNKGGESCYYYHDHEKPYPILFQHETVSILIPREYNGGKSYAVIKEGIVG